MQTPKQQDGGPFGLGGLFSMSMGSMVDCCSPQRGDVNVVEVGQHTREDVVGLYQPRPASAAKPKGQTQPRPTSAPKPTRETGPVNSKEQEDVVKHRKGMHLTDEQHGEPEAYDTERDRLINSIIKGINLWIVSETDRGRARNGSAQQEKPLRARAGAGAAQIQESPFNPTKALPPPPVGAPLGVGGAKAAGPLPEQRRGAWAPEALPHRKDQTQQRSPRKGAAARLDGKVQAMEAEDPNGPASGPLPRSVAGSTHAAPPLPGFEAAIKHYSQLHLSPPKQESPQRGAGLGGRKARHKHNGPELSPRSAETLQEVSDFLEHQGREHVVAQKRVEDERLRWHREERIRLSFPGAAEANFDFDLGGQTVSPRLRGILDRKAQSSIRAPGTTPRAVKKATFQLDDDSPHEA